MSSGSAVVVLASIGVLLVALAWADRWILRIYLRVAGAPSQVEDAEDRVLTYPMS